MARGRRGLDRRHRDKGGKLKRNTAIRGSDPCERNTAKSFAKGHRKDMMLKTLLKETGSTSLHEYLRQHHSDTGRRHRLEAYSSPARRKPSR